MPCLVVKQQVILILKFYATRKVYILFNHKCPLFSIRNNKALWGWAMEFGVHLHQADWQQGLHRSSGGWWWGWGTYACVIELANLILIYGIEKTGLKSCQFSLFSSSASVLPLGLSPGLHWWKIPVYVNKIILSLNIWRLVMWRRERTHLYGSHESIVGESYKEVIF